MTVTRVTGSNTLPAILFFDNLQIASENMEIRLSRNSAIVKVVIHLYRLLKAK